MEDKGNNTNASSSSGGCIKVAVVVAKRMARAALRAVAVAVAEQQ
jgi:hypothetical protein